MVYSKLDSELTFENFHRVVDLAFFRARVLTVCVCVCVGVGEGVCGRKGVCLCACYKCVLCVLQKVDNTRGKTKQGRKKQNSVSAESSTMNLHVLWAHMYPAVLGPAIFEPCMNESCDIMKQSNTQTRTHTHIGMMSHVWMSHVTYSNHVTYRNESCHVQEWVMSHIHDYTKGTHISCCGQSCYFWVMYEWVMSRTGMSHVTYSK